MNKPTKMQKLTSLNPTQLTQVKGGQTIVAFTEFTRDKYTVDEFGNLILIDCDRRRKLITNL